jgi:uncharacterized protein YejL (UPF0352 family)
LAGKRKNYELQVKQRKILNEIIYSMRTVVKYVVGTSFLLSMLTGMLNGDVPVKNTKEAITKKLATTLIKSFEHNRLPITESVALAQKNLVAIDPFFEAVQFSIPQSKNPGIPPLKFEIENISADMLLDMLAEDADREVVIQDGVINFLPYDESKAPLLTGEVIWPPTVFELGQSPKKGKFDVKKELVKKGIKFDRKGSSALYDTETGKLTIKNTKKQLKRCESLATDSRMNYL